MQLAVRIESKVARDEIEGLVGRLRVCVETRDVENQAGRVPKVFCPLLAPDRICAMYEARPASCAAGMANDVGPCRSYAEGHDDYAGGFISLPEIVAPAATAAIVIGERGGPRTEATGGAVDLHTGLATALATAAETTAARWLAGEDVFREARDRRRRRQAILEALGEREEVLVRGSSK